MRKHSTDGPEDGHRFLASTGEPHLVLGSLLKDRFEPIVAEPLPPQMAEMLDLLSRGDPAPMRHAGALGEP
jgi:hypothetical protein